MTTTSLDRGMAASGVGVIGDHRDWDNKDQDRRDHDDRDGCMPRGHVDGGDGGMTTTSLDRGMAASGVGVIGAAALGGMVLLRRRRANDLG
ncbi:hypothetical protein JNW87_26290 [Micromonospora sp. ATA51]|nr:hypothetical protein [Micromonospora sp. ATA51]